MRYPDLLPLVLVAATSLLAQADSIPLIFLPALTYNTGGEGPNSVAVGDLNGDGKPDLVVSNECSNAYPDCTLGGVGAVGVLLGNGDGTFQSPVSYNSGGYEASSVAVADVNGDGKLDVVVANSCTSNANCAIGGDGRIEVLLGKGDGTLNPLESFDSGAWVALSVAIGDVNGDGHPDLIVAHNCSGPNTCNAGGVVTVLLGKGDGTFKPAVGYSTGGQEAISVAIGDVNGDGKPDLAVANICQTFNNCSNGGVVVLLGVGDGTFQPAVSYGSGGSFADSIAIHDLNADGKPDVVVANFGCDATCNFPNSVVSALLGNGNGTFQPAASYNSGVKDGGFAAFADVNGDGKLDAVSTGRYGLLGVLLGNDDGSFRPGVAFPSGIANPNSIGIADVNHDGQPDVLVTNFGSVGALLNNGHAPPTTTSLITSVNPVNVKQAITYTATVAGPGGTLQGNVVFQDNAAIVATMPLTNNQASYSTSYTSNKMVGAHSITASYSGVYQSAEGSQSALTEYVRVAPTTTVLITSGSPSRVGQSVTFTATVTANPKFGSIPNGELVTFYDGAKLLASVPLASGKAVYSISTLSVKTHHIKAIYAGDNTFKPSIGHVVQTVEQ